ncbi:hypothetical protein PF0749 [Pyrococcus furiosus DSM 3638]|uniref:Uncharacterized protein n=1 Tax=Pyrococcus furiosus (strain ATCC 43587 / DSM 3638 / JCM 8422 / Vc1) TaxID=186497 RepID=Q8U2T1_PYRFU|nr:hypothetical protein PF0749 [Pyrococcus furiosus DSM 3638]
MRKKATYLVVRSFLELMLKGIPLVEIRKIIELAVSGGM